ncbi:MAG: DNA polymerase III subunit gamma/tau, partial [Chlamydiae bacterium]|nr:DNA polymerase III subunit gamma/tau [Chlamydiota bacterium]
DVLGQKGVVQTLKNALTLKKTSHAYLFTGVRGTGKTSIARIFAKALNCLSPVDQIEPCNECSSCKEIIAGRSLDVVEIDGASNRGIDDIRKLSENIGIATFQGKYRIYIIDEVHMLTKEAFNALLKTLEEPPQNVKFLLATTEPHKILPTILSRCQRFDLKRIQESLIAEKLASIAKELEIAVEEDVFLLIASLAEGSLRDAETLLDRILVTQDPPITVESATKIFSLLPSTLFSKLDETFLSQRIDQVFEIAEEIFLSGFNTNYFLDSLIHHFRNILFAHYNPKETKRWTKQEQQVAKRALEIYSAEKVHFIIDYLITLQSKKQTLELSRIEIEMILLYIVQTKQRVSISDILDKLEENEPKAPPAPLAEKKTAPIETVAPTLAPKVIETKTIETKATETPKPVEALNPVEEVKQAPKKVVQSEISLEKAAQSLREYEEKNGSSVQEKDTPLKAKISFSSEIEKGIEPQTEQKSVPTELPAIEQNASIKIDSTPPSLDESIRQETLLRFAAVELGGTLKKHSY